MFRVELYEKGDIKYTAIFKTKEEAEEWAYNHISGIKDYKVLPDYSLNRKRKLQQLIKRRDEILCATDWLFISDVKINSKHRKMYMEYRQLLRDIPQKLKESQPVEFESFGNWVRRKYPEEFLDGGEGHIIIEKFNYYL